MGRAVTRIGSHFIDRVDPALVRNALREVTDPGSGISIVSGAISTAGPAALRSLVLGCGLSIWHIGGAHAAPCFRARPAGYAANPRYFAIGASAAWSVTMAGMVRHIIRAFWYQGFSQPKPGSAATN